MYKTNSLFILILLVQSLQQQHCSSIIMKLRIQGIDGKSRTISSEVLFFFLSFNLVFCLVETICIFQRDSPPTVAHVASIIYVEIKIWNLLVPNVIGLRSIAFSFTHPIQWRCHHVHCTKKGRKKKKRHYLHTKISFPVLVINLLHHQSNISLIL